MRLRAWLLLRLPGSQRQALAWSLPVLLASGAVAILGVPTGLDVNTFGCHPPPDHDDQCRSHALINVASAAAVGIGGVLFGATLFLVPSLFGQLRQAARDRAYHGPRLQSLKDWYAHRRIRKTTLDGLAPTLEALLEDREPATGAWAVSRTWTAVALGTTFGLLLALPGAIAVLDAGTAYCDDAPNPGCTVYRAGAALVGATMTGLVVLAFVLHVTGWPFRAQAARRRRRLLEHLDALERAALEEAHHART